MGLYDNYKPEQKVETPQKTGGLYANYNPEKKPVNYQDTYNNPEYKKQIAEIEAQGNAEKAKAYTGFGIKTLSPLVGLGLAPFTAGASLPASMAITAGAEGLTYGVGDSISKDLKGADFAKNTAKEGAIGATIGGVQGAAFKVLPRLFGKAKAPVQQASETLAPKIADDVAEAIPSIGEAKPQITVTPEGRTVLSLEADYNNGSIPPVKPPQYEMLGDNLPQAQSTALAPQPLADGGDNLPPIKPPVITAQASELPMNTGGTVAEQFINQGEKTGQKVRKTYESLEGSKFGEDPEFMGNIEPNKMYDTVTNADTFAQTMKLSNEEADKIIQSETPSALRTMANIKKLGDALDAEDQRAATDLGNELLRRGTEMGQSIQAYSLIKKLSPNGAVLTMLKVNRESTPKLAQNLIDNADEILKDPLKGLKNAPKKFKDKILTEATKGKLTKEKYLTELNKFYKLKDITAEDIQKAKILAEKVQSSEGREKEIAIGQLRALISSKKPISNLRKISTAQTMAQLLNPKTIGRNIIGNSLYQGLENVTQVPATLIDKGVSRLTGNRSTTLPNIKTQLQKGWEGGAKAVEDIKLGIDTSGNDKFDLFQGRTFDQNSLLGKGETLMNYGLRVPDRFAFEGAKADIIDGFRKLGNEITPEIEAYAEELARKKTFQDDSALSKLFTGGKQALNFNKDWGLGDLFLKYAKTPANLISRGLSYSPVGLAKGGAELGSLLKTGQVGDLMGVAAQNKAVGDVSRGLVGSGIMGLGGLAATNGIANGAMIDNDIRGTMDLQANEKLAGNQPYSLQIGNNNYTYDWLQPNISFSAGVNMANKDGLGLLEGVASGVNTVTEQPLFQGIQNLAANLNTEQDKGIAARRDSGSSVSNAGRKFRRPDSSNATASAVVSAFDSRRTVKRSNALATASSWRI